jgi:precorrin-6A/cobalt-precorrin-6A reductase
MRRNAKILVLGGTREARDIADMLDAGGLDVTTSLAGVTQTPKLPRGKLRMGGFGGPEGLRDFLRVHGFTILVDATHPYAAQISRNAQAAVSGLETLHYRMERPSWQPSPGDQWIEVASAEEAAAALPPGAKVMLTIGRKDIAPFLERGDLSGVVRSIETVGVELPSHWQSLLERPPYTLAGELAFMRSNGITHLVSKNAGSDDTSAKLSAARELSIPVVMLRRLAKSGGTVFSCVEQLTSMFVERELFQRAKKIIQHELSWNKI